MEDLSHLPNPYIKWINDRCLKKNKNVIGIFLGPTGDGKTYAALNFAQRIAESNGTNFKPETNIAFNYKDMLLNMERPENQKPGTVFIFEEVGSNDSGASSNQWQSKGNTFFSSFMQTARHRNQVLLMTTPNFSLLAKQVRQLIHLVCEMESINKTEKRSIGKMKICQTNPMSGKIYMRYLRINYNGDTIRIERTFFYLPDKEVLDVYEKMKMQFTKELNKKILTWDQDKRTNKDKKANIDLNKLKLCIEKGLTQEEIGAIFEVSRQTIAKYQKELKKNESEI